MPKQDKGAADMLKIAVVEDDVNYARQLSEYLCRYERERGAELTVTQFSDGDQLIEGYRPEFDMILMDIEMPLLDGMETARLIRRTDPEVVIIFITNMAQYAIQGYEVDALDYVLKPISYVAFSQRLDRALRRMKKREERYLTVSTREGVRKLGVSQIYYVESQGHTLLYHTNQGIVSSSGTMRDLEKELEPLHFFRGNKGYLINLEHVSGVREGCALVAGEELLLSRSRKNAFLEALTNYVGEAVK